ncbi:Do family serine endopeptidase [bacterium]|nr:Do family serine endopeptidase [bacterium]
MKQNKSLIIIFLAVIIGSYFLANTLLDQKSNLPPNPAATHNTTNTKPDENYFHTNSNPLGMPAAIGIAQPNSFAELVKKVKPAVVNVSTAKEVRQNPYAGNPFFNNPYRNNQQNASKEAYSLGTGFIINEEGYVLTNFHVIQGADEISVKLDDGREFNAKAVGRDQKLDIAVLKIDGQGPFPYTSLGNSDDMNVGDWVVAIGNPFGLGHTVTAGIVSAKARVLGAGPYDDFIQTDASINPGNSGGPLFNTNGEVIGINTAIIATGQGLGFAIPINIAKDIVPQLISKGSVSRGWLGVAIREMTSDEIKALGLTQATGSVIGTVVKGGPADKAGIKAGDIVLEFNGEKVDNAHMLPTLVAKALPGSQAKIVFMQGGSKYERTITLGSLDDPNASLAGGNLAETTIAGMDMVVRELTQQELSSYRAGVLVTQVKPSGDADALGIAAGDVLVEINNTVVDGMKTFVAKYNAVQPGKIVRLSLVRDGQIFYIAFRKE